MICHDCEKANPPDANRCVHCGADQTEIEIGGEG